VVSSGEATFIRKMSDDFVLVSEGTYLNHIADPASPLVPTYNNTKQGPSDEQNKTEEVNMNSPNSTLEGDAANEKSSLVLERYSSPESSIAQVPYIQAIKSTPAPIENKPIALILAPKRNKVESKAGAGLEIHRAE